MNKPEKNIDITILYAIAIVSLIIGLISFTGVIGSNQNKTNTDLNNIEWRCTNPICTEIEEISGEDWVRENCFPTTEGTICVGLLEDGSQFQATLEQLREEVDLNTITATRCLSYVCTEEMPYRIVNYTRNT